MGTGRGKIYYGLHMAEGLAEYTSADGSPYRILLSRETIAKMNSSFMGCPLFIGHPDDVEAALANGEQVGVVVESFYNKADGRHWAKFLVTDERAQNLLKDGWTLSNCYNIAEDGYGPGSEWHGIKYETEVLNAEYEHLGIVDNPRYGESEVYTPEEFAAYNAKCEQEHARLLNSKSKTGGVKNMKWNPFKKTKVENELDLDELMITLPKSKKEMSIANALDQLDEAMVMEAVEPPAPGTNVDAKIKVGEKEMTLQELIDAYIKLTAPSVEEPADPSLANEDADEEGELDEDEVENEDDDSEDKKKEPKKEEKKENAKKLKNAEHKAVTAMKSKEAVRLIETMADRAARGKQLY